MDNLKFKKIWKDESLLELKISANCEFVSAYQNCYIEDIALREISKKIYSYISNHNSTYYFEFGKRDNNYTPAFCMSILAADTFGHVKIEVDIEIFDNDNHLHRCCFYVNTELGSIERLSDSLIKLINAPDDFEISLNT